MLGPLVDGVLGIADTAIIPTELAAGDVPRDFQLFEGSADGVHTLLTDGGQSSRGVVPVVAEGKHHGEQPFGFQGQIFVPQMIV